MTETTAVLINLENCWRFIRTQETTFSACEPEIRSLMGEITRRSPVPVIFFFALTKEPEFLSFAYEVMLMPLKKMLESMGIPQLNFITGTYSKDWLDLHIKHVGNVENIQYKKITVDTYVQYYMLWNKYRLRTMNQAYNTEPNQTADKCLLLTGKALTTHRIGLVYKFYKRGLLARMEWSLFVNDYVREHARQFVPDCTDEEYYKFLAECERYPDVVTTHGGETGESGSYTGYPYDVKLFENTSLSIISETLIHRSLNSVVLTEKTWKTISNNHPFIMAHVPGTLQKLKELGFRTFEDYMLIKDYDSITDDDTRLNAVVDNMEYFLDNYQVNAESIVRDVRHNYQRYLQYCNEDLEKLNSRLALHGQSAEEFLFSAKELDL